MRLRRFSTRVRGIALGAGLLFVAACLTDYQEGLDDPRYGPPGNLERPDAGGGSSAPPACTTPVTSEGGTCTVSFKQILESFRAAQCGSSSCHGGSTPPKINPDDAEATYNAFSTFVISTGTPYIDPCSTDPSKSAIACNLSTASTCGNRMPQGGSYDQTKLSEIETWLACGAPNN